MKRLFNLLFIFVICIIPLNINAMTKTETIYSTLDYDGSIKKTTINTRLSSIDKGDIVDYSNLSDIKNLNGDEKFSKDSSKITWKSTGRDIYYQGSINDNLPIKVSASYYLNGEKVNPNKIKGKSGSVKIVFDFDNTDYNYDFGMYVPYVVDVTGSFNSKNNSNFTITNGKCVSVGDKNICSAISAPGLYESTKISEFNSLDTIEVSYDTTNYEKVDFYFVITPKLLSKVDLNKLSLVDSKLSSVNALSDGTNQLVSGSNDLYNGVVEFDNGLSLLNDGIKSALDGSYEITNGLSEVNKGTKSLSSLTTLVDKLYETYNNNLQLLQGIESGVTEQQLIDGINSATTEKNNLENLLSQVNANILQLEQLGDLDDAQASQLDALRSQKEQLEMYILQYENGIAEAQANIAKLPGARYKLLGANEVIGQVLCGVLGVDDMDYVNDQTIAIFKENINKLVYGVNSLYEGSSKLNSGLQELYNGSSRLVEGSKKLEDGTKSLSDGLDRLNREGISKIALLANQVGVYSTKIKNLSYLSNNYSGYASNNSNNTLFIYKLS